MRLAIAVLAVAAGAVAAIALAAVPSGSPAIVFAGAANAPAGEAPYEVWAIDQSNTSATGGGTLYVYDGPKLAGLAAARARPEAIDLGGEVEAFCVAETAQVPTRPHMILFNAAQTHGILSYVASGHVLFMDAASREPVACIDVGAGAHAAFPAPDESYVVVANLAGRRLHRIWTDYAAGEFTLDPVSLDLAAGTTPSGALREGPDRPINAPICPVFDSSSRFTFVTLRGGGLFVVDTAAAEMAIVAEYDRSTVGPSGCGGVETAGKMYLNAGGGWPENPLRSALYVFPLAGFSSTPSAPNTPAPAIVFDQGAQGDSHGAILTKHDRYLWAADRADNTVVVVDTATDRVVNEFQLSGSVSGDPAPDLLAISPNGNRVFATFRGPTPLTGNAPAAGNAVGATPGVGVIRVEQGGRSGTLQAIARISHDVGGAERADPHGIAVRTK